MLAELEAFVPRGGWRAARRALEAAVTDLDFVRPRAAAFAQAPKISIDYAVMERNARAGVLPVSFSWSDVGTWTRSGRCWTTTRPATPCAAGVADRHEEQPRAQPGRGPDRGGGPEDVVVVSTPDAVLVASKAHSGQVEGAGRRAAGPRGAGGGRASADVPALGLVPADRHRRALPGEADPGGAGGRLSLQKHYHRAEHWVVVRGTAEVTIDRAGGAGPRERGGLPADRVDAPAGQPGQDPAVELIEVQVGSYTGEDDIIRVEDIYGR